MFAAVDILLLKFNRKSEGNRSFFKRTNMIRTNTRFAYIQNYIPGDLYALSYVHAERLKILSLANR